MRKEPFGVGNYVHVFNRGNRKMDIVRNDNDRWRFLAGLRFYNDRKPAQYIIRSFFVERKLSDLVRSNLTRLSVFEWPANEEVQTPIVSVISYYLAPNHYHLLLKEIIRGGIAEFMRKIGTGYTLFANKKYNEVGKIFQGSYRARAINDERYLQYVDAYIQVLNCLENVDPKYRFKNGQVNLDAVMDDPFSSLGEALDYRNFSILDRQKTQQKFSLPDTKEKYQKLMKSVVAEGGFSKLLGKLAIDKPFEI